MHVSTCTTRTCKISNCQQKLIHSKELKDRVERGAVRIKTAFIRSSTSLGVGILRVSPNSLNVYYFFKKKRRIMLSMERVMWHQYKTLNSGLLATRGMRDPSQIKHRNTQQLSTNNDDHSISISISITRRASTVLIGLVYNNEIHTESDSIKIRKCGIDPTEQSQGSKLSRPGHGPFPQ